MVLKYLIALGFICVATAIKENYILDNLKATDNLNYDKPTSFSDKTWEETDVASPNDARSSLFSTTRSNTLEWLSTNGEIPLAAVPDENASASIPETDYDAPILFQEGFLRY